MAHHEAGHAICGWFLEHSDPLVKVSIVPRSGVSEDGSGGTTLGFAQYSPHDKFILSREQFLDKICVLMGGRTAELLFFGSITSGAADDLRKITLIVYSMVRELGFSEKVGWLSFSGDEEIGQDTRALIDCEVRRVIFEAQERTRKLLEEKKDQVEIVAKHLLEDEVLVRADMERLIGKRGFPEEVL